TCFVLWCLHIIRIDIRIEAYNLTICVAFFLYSIVYLFIYLDKILQIYIIIHILEIKVFINLHPKNNCLFYSSYMFIIKHVIYELIKNINLNTPYHLLEKTAK
ncbi:hypothetical protein ACJX0J_028895, partial [Zea mays]